MKKILFTILSVLTLGVSVSFGQIDTTNLYGFFGFNESGVNQTGKGPSFPDGTYTEDRFGNLNGAVVSTSGLIVSDSVFNNTNTLCISFWFKVSSVSPIDNQILSYGNFDGNVIDNTRGYSISTKQYNNSNDSFSVYTTIGNGDGDRGISFGGDILTTNTWNNVIVFILKQGGNTIVQTFCNGITDNSNPNGQVLIGDVNPLNNVFKIDNVTIDDMLFYKNATIDETFQNTFKAIIADTTNYLPKIDTMIVSISMVKIQGKNLKGNSGVGIGTTVLVNNTKSTNAIINTNEITIPTNFISGTISIVKNYDTVTYKITHTGIKSVQNFNVSVDFYPNPTQGILNIETDITDYTVVVYNVKGEVVTQSTNSKNIDLSNVVKGFYFVKILSKDVNVSKRILVN